MNITEMRKTLDIFKPGKLVEVRSFGKLTTSGYFKNIDSLIQKIQAYPNETYYFPLNDIKDECYSRDQNETILAKTKIITTSDKDIARREWILIDADPVRASGISSANEEKAQAKVVIQKVYSYLRDTGFSNPVVADSGNGYHLLYKISMVNDDETQKLIKNFLAVTDMLFSNEYANIDTSVFNASRITKLYGTVARKGANTAGRPHRESKILIVPDAIRPTSIDLIQKVAAQLPEPEKPTYTNHYNSQFDLRDFIARNSIRISREVAYSGGTKFLLEHCIFDPSHQSPDSALFLMDSGAIGYKCFHNSCSGRTWRDVRTYFEPGCYDREREQPRTTKPQPISRQDLTQPANPAAAAEKNDRFLRLQDIAYLDRSKIVSIKSGFDAMDKKIIGFNKGEFSIWSGGNGSGKSTVLSQLALDSINLGFNVAIFSGELTANRMKNWLHLQAAGRQLSKLSTNGVSYYVPAIIGDRIDQWSHDKLWIYNNNYGLQVENVLNDFKKHIEEHHTDVVIIDNLMSLDMTKVYGDKYDKQSVLVLALSDMAKKYNVHIHFVCHPRKPLGFLRKSDISGTADLTNAADNVFMVHRVNNDFKNLAAGFFPKGEAEKYFLFTNTIEIMKNRDLGVEDVLIGMYYEQESKRMLNERYENKVYGWQEVFEDFGLPIDDDIPEEWRNAGDGSV